MKLRERQNMDDVSVDTIAVIAKRLPPEKRNLGPTDRLEDLGIDSFGAVEMVFDLEEKFDIQIPYNSNDARVDLETVGDVINAIKKLVAERS
jgi:acyl carrier protein